MLFKDKVILVTGSTTGIGEAIARRCIAEGGMVMFHGRNEQRAQHLHNEFKQKSSFILADLADEKNYQRIIDATVSHFGALHCVVNNAASTMRTDLNKLDSATFNYLINVNLKAPLLISQAAISQFRKQKSGGAILNIGSINAYCGESMLLVYSMTKAGLMTMTRNLADSLGHEKIRINQINVGWTATPNEVALKIKEGLSENWYENVSPIFAPSGRLLSPENIAEHAIFWLSERSAPASGSVFEVEQYPLIGRNKITGSQQYN